MPRSSSSRIPLLCAAAVVALVVAGCGGGNKTTPAPATSPSTTQTQSQTTATHATSTQPAAAMLSLATLEKNLPAFLNSGRINVQVPGQGSTAIHAEVTSASCPKEVPKRAGTKFRCTVKGSGGVHGYIDITLTDAQGKSFEYEANISGSAFGKFSGKVG